MSKNMTCTIVICFRFLPRNNCCNYSSIVKYNYTFVNYYFRLNPRFPFEIILHPFVKKPYNKPIDPFPIFEQTVSCSHQSANRLITEIISSSLTG